MDRQRPSGVFPAGGGGHRRAQLRHDRGEAATAVRRDRRTPSRARRLVARRPGRQETGHTRGPAAEPFGERLRLRALLAVFGGRTKAAERLASLRMPRQIAEGIVAAVRQVVPDGYTVRLTGADGRGLLVDGPLGMSASPAFALPVLPGLRGRSVAACAGSVLEQVADFVTDHEGGPDWLDPDHLADGRVEAHASVHDGHLHLAFRAGPTVVRELDPVPLPDGWR